jgi:flagellar motor switch/type III secretory pathway protein FliN
LVANKPALVDSGDQFAIFPYTFTIEITEKWIRNAQVDVRAGTLSILDKREFQTPAPVDQVALRIQLHPVGATFLVEAARAFLEKLSARLLAPLCPVVTSRLGLTLADTGLLELLVVAVLERINCDLQFPLQATLTSEGSPPVRRSEAGGLAFSFAIRVGELTGTFRLLITDDTMEILGGLAVPHAHVTLPEISWAFPLSAGYVELTSAEIAIIEPADVVLLTRETAILFPNAPERGWRLRHGPDNLSQAIVDNYFERGCLSERESKLEAGTTPDLAGLPIRMHAIIGEKEMTLAQANLLVAGAIVELDRTKSDPVRIALNGKIAGDGELVEVDGRLGVRILAWRTP